VETASVRCFRGQVSGTASTGRVFPGGLGQLRPPADIELAAYGIDLRGLRVADIGTGEGRLALGAARDAGQVIGVDPDRSAVARARSAAKRQGVSNVKFSEGAAQSLRLPDASFDVVIFSWTL
jgi:ubiquinone/menaquinone biosynthesis C-methylase UbiE